MNDFARELLWEADGKQNEFPGCAKLLREAADRLRRQSALISAIMDIEKAEPDGDPYDPASWKASAAQFVVAGSEFDRVREAMWQAQGACRYYDEDLEVARGHFNSIVDLVTSDQYEAVHNLADAAARSIAMRLPQIRALTGIGPDNPVGGEPT